jgi:membrane associated rhomboid family serine protease
MVFLAQFVFEQQGVFLEQWGALWPWQSPYFGVWQLFTHMFMHGNFLHLLFNMFCLWSFGQHLERDWGPKRFFQFYMMCGLLAGVTHLVFSGSAGYAVGASGAIMGLFAAFAYLYPNTPLFLMFIPIPIKAKYAIPGLMALDLFGIFGATSDNIAHWAHLGGAVSGLIIVIIWNKTNRKTFY